MDLLDLILEYGSAKYDYGHAMGGDMDLDGLEENADRLWAEIIKRVKELNPTAYGPA